MAEAPAFFYTFRLPLDINPFLVSLAKSSGGSLSEIPVGHYEPFREMYGNFLGLRSLSQAVGKITTVAFGNPTTVTRLLHFSHNSELIERNHPGS